MRYLVIFFTLIMITGAETKDVKLENFSVKDVESRCQKVHGEFVTQDNGAYGCKFSKGVVECDAEQHCIGTLKEQPHKLHHRPHHRYPSYQGYRWYPYQQW